MGTQLKKWNPSWRWLMGEKRHQSMLIRWLVLKCMDIGTHHLHIFWSLRLSKSKEESESSMLIRIWFVFWSRIIQWIGLREKLQEKPIFNGKIYGFLLRFSRENQSIESNFMLKLVRSANSSDARGLWENPGCRLVVVQVLVTECRFSQWPLLD